VTVAVQIEVLANGVYVYGDSQSEPIILPRTGGYIAFTNVPTGSLLEAGDPDREAGGIAEMPLVERKAGVVSDLALDDHAREYALERIVAILNRAVAGRIVVASILWRVPVLDYGVATHAPNQTRRPSTVSQLSSVPAVYANHRTMTDKLITLEIGMDSTGIIVKTGSDGDVIRLGRNGGAISVNTNTDMLVPFASEEAEPTSDWQVRVLSEYHALEQMAREAALVYIREYGPSYLPGRVDDIEVGMDYTMVYAHWSIPRHSEDSLRFPLSLVGAPEHTIKSSAITARAHNEERMREARESAQRSEEERAREQLARLIERFGVPESHGELELVQTKRQHQPGCTYFENGVCTCYENANANNGPNTPPSTEIPAQCEVMCCEQNSCNCGDCLQCDGKEHVE